MNLKLQQRVKQPVSESVFAKLQPSWRNHQELGTRRVVASGRRAGGIHDAILLLLHLLNLRMPQARAPTAAAACGCWGPRSTGAVRQQNGSEGRVHACMVALPRLLARLLCLLAWSLLLLLLPLLALCLLRCRQEVLHVSRILLHILQAAAVSIPAAGATDARAAGGGGLEPGRQRLPHPQLRCMPVGQPNATASGRLCTSGLGPLDGQSHQWVQGAVREVQGDGSAEAVLPHAHPRQRQQLAGSRILLIPPAHEGVAAVVATEAVCRRRTISVPVPKRPLTWRGVPSGTAGDTGTDSVPAKPAGIPAGSAWQAAAPPQLCTPAPTHLPLPWAGAGVCPLGAKLQD